MGSHSFCPVRSVHNNTFYIAHMETELKSHSFQHQTLGSYAYTLCDLNICLPYLQGHGAQPVGSSTVSDYVKSGGSGYNLVTDNCIHGANRMMKQNK